jgi:hypothetical protein
MRLQATLVLVAAVLAAAVCAAPASADSIVYLKDGAVWIANADGSGARAFTLAPFHWAWPSEADDGTVVVAGGNGHGPYGDAGSDLYRFAPDGNQIGDPIPTPGTYYDLNCPTTAPWSVRVSPDASKIAYSTVLCATSDFTTLWTPSTATGLSWPNQNNGVGDEDYEQPAWIDSTHYMASHAGPPIYSSQARWYVQDTSHSPYGTGWTEDAGFTGTGGQGLVSRQGTTFAIFEDDAADYVDGLPRHVTVWLYAAPSLTQALTTGWGDPKCKAVLDAAHTTNPFRLSPSFSPDGTKLLWGDDLGVEVASVANLTADGAGHCTAVTPHLLIAGGAQPFYGKAAMQAAAAQPRQPGVTPPATTGGTGTTTTPTPQPQPTPAPQPTPTPTPTPIPAASTKPIARFKLMTRRPRARHKVIFDAGASTEAGGRIVSYRWSFGDHHSATGRRVRHAFRRPGRYTVRLTVRDAAGHTATFTLKLRVQR